MRKDAKTKLMQVAVCLVCAIAVWRYGSALERTEFSGGWLTAPLLEMKDVGSLLFVVALLLTFFYRRIAAAIALLACLLCLTLFLNLTAPGPFRRVFGGQYSVPLQANFVGGVWAITGMIALAIAAAVCLRSLLGQADPKYQNSR
jgi:hypothetical protein